MVSTMSVEVVANHVNEISSIMALPDRNFAKFYRSYTGEKIKGHDVNECRLLIVKMLTDKISNDISEVLKDGKETEYSFFDCEE